eukprot:3075144-Amphidinium_carterae.1
MNNMRNNICCMVLAVGFWQTPASSPQARHKSEVRPAQAANTHSKQPHTVGPTFDRSHMAAARIIQLAFTLSTTKPNELSQNACKFARTNGQIRESFCLMLNNLSLGAGGEVLKKETLCFNPTATFGST